MNLIDAEGGWLLKLVALLIGVAISTRVLKVLLERLHQQFQSKGQIWKEGFVRALYRPLTYYLWFVVFAYSVNLVTDNMLSDHYKDPLSFSFSVVAVFAIAWFLLSWKTDVLAMYMKKHKRGETEADIGKILGFSKIATAFIAVITVLLLMEVTGQKFQTIIAFGGISGLALAIASQEIIGNFFGGIMVYVTKPFAVGDLIDLPSSHLKGYIEDIGWYQTSLRGDNKKPIYIPNSLFSKTFVINASRRTHKRIYETISVRHEDLFRVPKIIQDLEKYLENLTGIDAKEKILINISAIGPYSVNISISALSIYVTELEFNKLRDSFFVKAGELIEQHGAKFATSMHIPPENKHFTSSE